MELDIWRRVGYSLVDSSIVSESVASAETSRGIQACLGVSPRDVLSLYQLLLSAEFFEQQRQKEKLRENNRIYNCAVVMWLMIAQRLQGHGTLETAVLEVGCGLPSSFWPKPCKRLQVDAHGRKPHLSGNTASYNDARQALPVSLVEQSFDRAYVQMADQLLGTVPALGVSAFFYDGTSLRTNRSAALCAAYPPGSNQHGEGHWPLIQMVVAHDLYTGLAMRPEWGPMYGPHAVSEQGLIEQSMDRLPAASVVVYDANSVFSVAYAGRDPSRRPSAHSCVSDCRPRSHPQPTSIRN